MHPSRPAREFWYATVAGATVALVCYLVPAVALLVAETEYRALDWRFHLRGPLPPNPELVIVAIDEASLEAVGQFPWPRRRMAELLDAVEAAGPVLVAFDVLFAEPGEEGGDQALAEALRRHGNVYLPLFVTEAAPPAWLFDLPALKEWQVGASAVRPGGPDARFLYELEGLTAPLPMFCQAAAGLGIVDLVGSGDGVYRDIALLGVTDLGLVPSLPLVLAAARLGVEPETVAVLPGEQIQIGDRLLPTDVYGLTPVNFAGPTGTYPYVSARDVLAGDPGAQAALRGRIALIGATAAGLYDLRPSPFDASFRGVEALANATGNVLAGDAVRFPRETKGVALSILLAIGVAAQVGLLPGMWSWVSGMAVMFAYWVLAVEGFARGNVALPIVPTTAACIAALVAGLAARLMTAERQQRRAVSVFSRFVPPSIAEQLVDADLDAATRGQRRVVTVLFGDIRNSSVYARRLSPEDLVEALNHFFSESHGVVWRHGGTLDKFLGDGVLAFFNAPAEQPDHALRAVRAALDLVAAVNSNQELWDFHGLRDLCIGVGIATGEVVVGYVGSQQRMQYTVIGATVNLASRLQDLARDLGVEVLISGDTYQQVAEWVEAEDVGTHLIRGFDEPVRVYRLLSIRGQGGSGA